MDATREEDQTRALSLRLAYQFAAEHGLEGDATDIRNMRVNWKLTYTSSVRRGFMVDLLQKHGLLNAFQDQHWAFGKTPRGEQKKKWYLRLKARYEDYQAGRGEDKDPERG